MPALLKGESCYHGGVLFEPERVIVNESGAQFLHGFMKLLHVALGDAVPGVRRKQAMHTMHNTKTLKPN